MPINKVGSKGITDGSVATAEFADGVVTSAKLQNGAVTNAKLSNTTVTLLGTSVTLGSSATFNNEFVDWQSVITADGSTGTTGVAGRGYFINTTSAAHTFTLPVSATRGDTISIKDYAGTFATNNLTIARNGHNIQGVANNSLISTNRASVVLVYVDATRGWEFVKESNVADLQGPAFISATGGTITTSGDFKIHSFTGDGCFVVATLGNPIGGGDTVDYLVVAGGGGGGGYSGGGGAGGYRTTFPSPGCNAGSFPVTSTTFPITVGAGGSGGAGYSCNGTQGSSSIFSTITSTGGGYGGAQVGNCQVAVPGGPGGSGGGGGMTIPTSGGTGNSPPTSPPQGNNGGGGTGSPGNYPSMGGGGGGGAGGTGSGGSAGVGGNGGPGSPNSITGSATFYAGGGGGSFEGRRGSGTPGSGGQGGGGEGANMSTSAVTGTANTGGGGGGGAFALPSGGVAGGKGIVVIRYKFQ